MIPETSEEMIDSKRLEQHYEQELRSACAVLRLLQTKQIWPQSQMLGRNRETRGCARAREHEQTQGQRKGSEKPSVSEKEEGTEIGSSTRFWEAKLARVPHTKHERLTNRKTL